MLNVCDKLMSSALNSLMSRLTAYFRLNVNQCILEEKQLFIYYLYLGVPRWFCGPGLELQLPEEKQSYRTYKEWDRKYQTLNVNSSKIQARGAFLSRRNEHSLGLLIVRGLGWHFREDFQR